jgi:hypothetical protein
MKHLVIWTQRLNCKRLTIILKKFKLGLVLIVIEHFAIIALAVMLFIAFNHYNLILAVVWTISRTTEGLIQIYTKKSSWGLLNIARQYSSISSTEKSSLIDLGHSILKTKNTVFSFPQIQFFY